MSNFKKMKLKKIIKCINYDMILTAEHKQIINKWLEAYTKMYNETLKFIKNDVTKSTIKVQDKKNIYELDELENFYGSNDIFNKNYNGYVLKKINKISYKINDDKSLEELSELQMLKNLYELNYYFFRNLLISEKMTVYIVMYLKQL